MTLSQIDPGTRFRQPATGLVGTVIRHGACGSLVRIDSRSQEVTIGAVHFTRPAELVTWSSGTDAVPEVTP